MSLTFKLKMVFSVLCFFFKPASWHLLLYQYRSIHFNTHISKEHSPIKSHVPCAPFILWAPAPPKVSARPWIRAYKTTITVHGWMKPHNTWGSEGPFNMKTFIWSQVQTEARLMHTACSQRDQKSSSMPNEKYI